jgi:acylphosphatase
MTRLTSRRWIVTGQVQGVGFRWYIHKLAREYEVVGWVTNLPDGSVEVVAKGLGRAITSLDGFIRKGPAGAKVEQVVTNDVPHDAVDTKSFNIKR